MSLSSTEIDQFIDHGFVKVERAFSRELAEACREILWADLPVDRHDPSTWTAPVIRLGEYAQEPFRQAANTPVLHEAFDQLVGPGLWIPRSSVGSFPVRFPSPEEPQDTGWHVDASFPGADPGDYMNWRINYRSRGRALLMLFLFSDVGPQDAPTRLRQGSQRYVAEVLAPFGEEGLSFKELAGYLEPTALYPEALATGEAGTVYLCHPFMVHAAQAHRGKEPKFMAQPPLMKPDRKV